MTEGQFKTIWRVASIYLLDVTLHGWLLSLIRTINFYREEAFFDNAHNVY